MTDKDYDVIRTLKAKAEFRKKIKSNKILKYAFIFYINANIFEDFMSETVLKVENLSLTYSKGASGII